jgi:hypothetical protein
MNLIVSFRFFFLFIFNSEYYKIFIAIVEKIKLRNLIVKRLIIINRSTDRLLGSFEFCHSNNVIDYYRLFFKLQLK